MKDVITLAKDAGLYKSIGTEEHTFNLQGLERFAALVRAEVEAEWIETNKALAKEIIVKTEALKLAEEALNAMLTHMGMDEDEWTKPTFDQSREALAAIREALAEPVKQEPVAYMVKAHDSVQRFAVRADVADEFACKWRETDPDADFYPLYAAPVDAKAIQHCPCCGSDYFAGKTKVDLDTAIKNDPLYQQGRAEALEEAANVLDEAIKHDWNIPHKPELVNCAAAIRGLK